MLASSVLTSSNILCLSMPSNTTEIWSCMVVEQGHSCRASPEGHRVHGIHHLRILGTDALLPQQA